MSTVTEPTVVRPTGTVYPSAAAIPADITDAVSLRTGRFVMAASQYGPGGAGQVTTFPVSAAQAAPTPGPEICWIDECGEIRGSVWCEEHHRGAIRLPFYEALNGQRTPEQIVRESPVNQPAVAS